MEIRLQINDFYKQHISSLMETDCFYIAFGNWKTWKVPASLAGPAGQ